MTKDGIDYERRLRHFLSGEGYKGVLLGRFDQLTGREGIVIRKLPSTKSEQYYDGSFNLQRLVQVIVRRRIADDAIEECDWLANLLDGATIESANGTYQFVNQEVYTEPEEFPVYEEGFSTWSFRLRANLLIERVK